MKGEDLLKIIGEIDDKYIRECEEYMPRKKINIFAVVRYVAAGTAVWPLFVFLGAGLVSLWQERGGCYAYMR